MKKILFLLMAVGILTFFGFDAAAKKSKGNKDGEAKIEFAQKVYDFGVVKEDGGNVSHEFEFVNKGDANLLIFKATAECGCTKPNFPKNPIAPGKSGKLKVTFNPAGRPGGFEKVVTVTTNGNPRKVRIKIRGTVSK